jgi:hypothetical protein
MKSTIERDESEERAYESVETPIERESVFTRLAQLDSDWDIERRQFLLSDRRGYARVPHHAMSVVWVTLGIALAGLWVPLLISALSGRDWHLLHIIVPAISAVFIGNGLYTFFLAIRYQRALERYELARANLLRKR